MPAHVARDLLSVLGHSLHGDVCLGLAWCRSIHAANKQGPDAHVAHRVVVIKFAQRAYWRAPSLSWAQTQPLPCNPAGHSRFKVYILAEVPTQHDSLAEWSKALASGASP